MSQHKENKCAEYRYPVGVQTFETVRTEGMRYVDKTHYIIRMRELSRCIFLSRPRRFGKSLLSSTIKSYYQGRKDLFVGLRAHDMRSDWTPNPVIHLDLSALKAHSIEEFNVFMLSILRRIAKDGGVQIDDNTIGDALNTLIRSLYDKTGRKVVLIIDEYDAQLLNVIDNDHQLRDRCENMQKLYSQIKTCDEYLEFVFITGITKFSQLSIFSELNSLMNISMMPEFDGVCGITSEELVTQFRSDVERIAEHLGHTFDEEVDELQARYDGYHFSSGMTDVYNPFSLIMAFARLEVGDYWFGSGTPNALIKMAKKYPFSVDELDSLRLPSAMFDVAVTEMQTALPVLYQSGYLTIKGYAPKWQIYTLSYPNQEVKRGMLECFAPAYIQSPMQHLSFITDFATAIEADNMQRAFDLLRTYSAGIPYLLHNDNERNFQLVFYVIFNLVGEYVDSEVQTSRGRIDAVVKTDKSIYVIEMKYGKPLGEARCQIEAKDYALQYKEDPRTVYEVPLIVNPETRRFEEWEFVRVAE